MNKRCPFHENGRCAIGTDYQVLQFTLQEAEELASANWKEIQCLYDRIHQLETALIDAGIDIPEEN